MLLKRVFKIDYTVLTIIIAALFTIGILSFGNIVLPTEAMTEKIDLPVVMYHHILNSKQGDYIVSPAQFEEDLIYIRDKGYTTITGEQLIGFFEYGEPLPENPVLITFDDGYESVHEYAFPLLQKYEMKAIVSIIGKHTDIFSNPDETKSINYSHLTWTQLREMQQSGVFEIQNHSYDMHDNCEGKRFGIRRKDGETSDEYKACLENDVGALSAKITEEIGVAPNIFAYPFGALCKESLPTLSNMGIKIYMTCEEKVNKIETGVKFPVSLKRFNRAAKYSTYEYFKKLGIK